MDNNDNTTMVDLSTNTNNSPSTLFYSETADTLFARGRLKPYQTGNSK